MPYAANGQISQQPIAGVPNGGVAITEQQYQDALAAILNGEEVALVDHAMVLRPKPPSPRHTWENGEWVAPPPEPQPAPTRADVEAEKDRRLAAGFVYDFQDARGVHQIGTTSADMRGWDEVTQLASALLAVGDTTAEISILTDTGPTTVTAPEWQQVLLAAAAFRQPIWHASFVLVAMDPIPDDFADDSYWAAN